MSSSSESSGHVEREEENKSGMGEWGQPQKNPFECSFEALKTYAKGPFNSKKPLLQLVTALDKDKRKNSGDTRLWRCHICHHHFTGSYTRVYSHLLGFKAKGVKVCEDIKEDERVECYRLHMEAESKTKGLPLPTQSAQSAMHMPSIVGSASGSASGDIHVYTRRKRKTISSEQPNTVASLFNVHARDVVESSIAKFFYAHAIPFRVARSPYFKQMFKDVIAVGSSFTPPGEHKLRSTLLDKEYSKVSLVMEDMRQCWIRMGCSIVMDGWTDIKHRPIINIIVTSSAGSYFLRAIDCSGKRKDVEFQFHILRDAIEEVGASNVVQVVTDSIHVCKLAGMMVEGAYKHIFWSPCCVHVLNNVLKDIEKIEYVQQVVIEARDIQMFICNHHMSLVLFRTFSKKKFLKPMETRYANYFVLLERMLEVQEPLQLMMINSEWSRWSTSNTAEGKNIKKKVLNDDWWSNVRYICSFISPVVDVIRYADTNSPSLGEIYETFNSMLGKMKQAISSTDPNLRLYEQHIEPIVMRWWNTMNTPLHMAAFALNPKWCAPKDGRLPLCDDEEVKEGLMRALGKMYSIEESSLLRTQWLAFTNLRGPTFGKPEAKIDRATLAQTDPIGWWTWHGKDAPELRMLAIRLLSQVASSSIVERNWSTYNFIHSIKRNRLTSRRAEKLVVVHSALRL